MIRTQIRLTEDQASALKQLASEQGVSMAELIRQGAARIIEEGGRRGRRRRALAVLGRYHDQASDVAANHDRYLDEAYGDSDSAL